MRLPFLRRRREPAQARHRAAGPSTYQQIQALTTADTRRLPSVVDGPVVLTEREAHQRAAAYRSAGLPTPYDRDRLAELEGDTHVMRRSEVRDALDGGDRGELVRPYLARPA